MVAELPRLDEVGDKEDDGQQDTEAGNNEPQNAQEGIAAAHWRQGSDDQAFSASIRLSAEVFGQSG